MKQNSAVLAVSEIERFELDDGYVETKGTSYPSMRSCADGDSVRYSDHQHSVAKLRAEITEYEQTDLVPRSRYDTADAEAREAREQTKDLAERARVEIESLESKLEHLAGKERPAIGAKDIK